jgi:4-hydroxy-tetrahydrodipicolinate reductase
MSPPTPAGPLRAVLIGAGGRMGQALLATAATTAGVQFVGAIVSKDSPSRAPAPGVPYSCDLAAALAAADIAIDFSSPAATQHSLAVCRAQKKPLLLGTTGFPYALEEQLAAAAREIPLLVAANTSLGVTLLAELVRIAAAALPGQFAVSIQESHHAAKRDAPSGTALLLAAAARAAPAGPDGAVPAIDIQSIRAGDIVGEHAVRFCASAEELTLSHKATDRSLFAQGALAAALWLSTRPPGRYSMRDVLAIKTVT